MLDNIFSHNGSLTSGGAIGITFRRELYNIILKSNQFMDNSAHDGDSIVYIINENLALSDSQINGSHYEYLHNGALIEVTTSENFVNMIGN